MLSTTNISICLLILLACSMCHVTGSPQWRPMGRFGKRTRSSFLTRTHPIRNDNNLSDEETENTDAEIILKPVVLDVNRRMCLRNPNTGKVKCFRADERSSRLTMKKIAERSDNEWLH